MLLWCASLTSKPSSNHFATTCSMWLGGVGGVGVGGGGGGGGAVGGGAVDWLKDVGFSMVSTVLFVSC